MGELHSICNDIGVIIVPKESRLGGRPRPCHTSAQKTLEKLLTRHGDGHLIIVLRTIVESRDNDRELVESVILAISKIILAHPSWVDRGLDWLEAFDSISLRDLREKAKKNKAAAKSQDAIATMLFERLSIKFGA